MLGVTCRIPAHDHTRRPLVLRESRGGESAALLCVYVEVFWGADACVTF